MSFCWRGCDILFTWKKHFHETKRRGRENQDNIEKRYWRLALIQKNHTIFACTLQSFFLNFKLWNFMKFVSIIHRYEIKKTQSSKEFTLSRKFLFVYLVPLYTLHFIFAEGMYCVSIYSMLLQEKLLFVL